jgi:Putative Ig domain
VLYARDGWIVLSRTLTGSTFALTGLPAGRYFLVAGRSPTHANAGYPARDCGLSGCQPALSDPIDVVAGQVVTGLEIRLRRFTGTASIAGRIVTSEAGAGIAGVATVCAIECVSVQSDNAGQFTVSGLGAGTYYVRASSFVGNRVSTWYGGTPVTGGANRGSPIVLGNGAAVTGVEVRLALGAEVRGRVTLPGFSPSPFVRVFIHNDQGVLLEEVSLSSSTPGTYAFTRLPQGTYYLRADGVDSYVVDEVYGGAPCLLAGCVLAGTPVTLAAGEVRDGIDFSLEVGGWIIGRARGRKDLGDRIVHLDLYNTAGALVMSTYGDTRFRIQGVPAGTYYLKATIGGRKVVYDDVPCQPECTPTAGTPIVVQAARATSGIEIVIDEGTSISGVIRDAGTGLPLSGVIVSLLDDSGAVVNGGATDLNGLYELRDVGPGRYFARTFNRIGYVDEQYDDRLCSSCEGLAGTPIDVLGPTPVAGIDFRLVRGGWVSGRVTDMHGAPVAGAGVTVYDGAGVRLQRALTAADGSYVATVPAGMVFVQSDPLEGYQVVTYPNVVCSTAVCSPLAGTAVAIVAGAQTEDINLVLPIVNVLTMTPVFLAGGVAGRAYSATIQVTDGAAPVQFSIVSGGLPPGMSLDVDQGLARARLSGTPASAGVFTFALRAIDSGGRFTQRLFSLTVAACALSLSQEEVSFPISGGSATVRVGGGCLWQATTSSAWVSLTSAETDVTVTASINAGSARTANVSIGSRVVVVRQAGPESAAPFGIVDIPIDGSTAVGSIAVGGWALDDLGIVRVTVYRDSVPPELPNQLVYLGDAVRVRGARPDVEMLYPNLPFRDRAGWGFLLLTNMLPNQGNGTFRLHAFAEDVEGKGVLLGSKTIVAANATATVPFGAIDTPGQGETISGSSYVNFGWALTPLPKTIPLHGSTITVFLDGAPAGNVDYNHFRPDIASLFPGLNNTNGAVGFRILDTTQLANGIHTISWVVSDNAGSIEGIGSRYFHVDNAGLAAAMTQSSGIYSVDAPDSVHPGPHRRMRIVEMERLTIDLAEVFGAASCGAPFTAYEVVGHERRPLPAGSSLDPATGRFAWQPGPGFIGTYRLVFAAPSCDGPAATVPIDVRIVRAAR